MTITDKEAIAIDKAVKKAQVDTLKSRYLAAAENTVKKNFFDLPAQAQTVVASVAFQYGDLSKKAPKFWKSVAAQSWEDAAKVLRDFGDLYKSRRSLEAQLLDELVPAKT